MRAICFDQPGEADLLRLCDMPVPTPKGFEVCIKVMAAGVNRPDILQRQGLYLPPADADPKLGLEVSGHITAIGPEVTNWRIGDAVCALTPGGGYAQFVLADEGSVMRVPTGISLRDAAALPEAVLTVWQNVFVKARLQPQERLLLHGASSGIGTTAIQMAKAHGADVFATARTDDKCTFARELGADCTINTKIEDFEAIIREAGGVDVVLDMVGGAFIRSHLAVLRQNGRLALIAFASGHTMEASMVPILQKHLHIFGSTLRPVPLAQKADLCRAVQKTVWPWVETGKVNPVIDSVFALKDAAKAHRRMQSGVHKGKILLIP